MADSTDARVAVYIDFDNIVISRGRQVGTKEDPTVDIGGILDFASTFGDIVLARAYADWSIPSNSGYSKQLVGRAVDLVQLFPTVASKTKNGADIRLAVDAIEDLFRLQQLTHVFIVAGDSDYIALAQRSKRLGRSVIGVGVAGSSSASLAAACDEFFYYDELPGVKDAAVAEAVDAAEPVTPPTPTSSLALPKRGPAGLLYRALVLLHSKTDADWLALGAVKTQMLRMEPTFNEKTLGYASFSAFVKSHASFAELDESAQPRTMRLRSNWRTGLPSTGSTK